MRRIFSSKSLITSTHSHIAYLTTTCHDLHHQIHSFSSSLDALSQLTSVPQLHILSPSPSQHFSSIIMMIRIDDMEPKSWEAMCLPINLVLPADERSNRGALYIGTWVASMDSEILDSHHIDDIVSINDEAMMSFNRTDDRGAHRIVLSDSSASDIRPHLDSACKYISSKLSNGENVLVHCQQVWTLSEIN